MDTQVVVALGALLLGGLALLRRAASETAVQRVRVRADRTPRGR